MSPISKKINYQHKKKRGVKSINNRNHIEKKLNKNEKLL